MVRDPAIRHLSNSSICEFGVASNRKYRGKDGNDVDDTCFMDCVAYAEKGAQIQKHFTKGKPILLEGRLKYESWEKDGQKRSKIVLVVENWHFVGAPPVADKSRSTERPDDGSQSGGDSNFGGEDDIPF